MINSLTILAIIIALTIYTTICYIDTKKYFENCLKKFLNNIDDVVCELHNKHNISCESTRDILRYCQVITIKIPLNKLDNIQSIITEQLKGDKNND